MHLPHIRVLPYQGKPASLYCWLICGSTITIKIKIKIYTVGCDIAFYFLIPFSIILFVCVRLAMTLRAARRQAMNRHGVRNTDSSVTTMLVLLLGVFLVCQIPGIFNRINGVLYRLHERSHFVGDIVLSHFVWPICTNINSSVNCPIYLAYNKHFRSQLCQRCTRGSTINHDYELTWSKINSILKRPAIGRTTKKWNNVSHKISRSFE